MLFAKLNLLLLMNFTSHCEKTHFVGLERIDSCFESLLCLQFLRVLLLDSLLNIFHFLIAMFVAVIFHGDALFFFQRASPDLYIIYLFVLLNLKSLSFSAEDRLVESHNLVIVEIFLAFLEFVNSVLANLFDSALQQFIQYFSCTNLSLTVKLVHQFILSAHLFVFNFLCFKLSFALRLFFLSLFQHQLHFLL